MRKEPIKLNCKNYNPLSKRILDFEVIKYTFNYLSNPSDKEFLDKIIKEGLELAKKVNPGAANNGSYTRDEKRINANAISGLLAEFLWLDYFKSEDIECEQTEFEHSSNQIDILLTKYNKKVEVRSSFPRNGIEFAICHNRYEFDVIGPYANDYKPGEIQKDFYVRTLYPFNTSELKQRIYNDNFEVFLTGGATWEMMIDSSISITKDFIPEDELSLSRLNQQSTYLVVPFSKALDSDKLINTIKNG